MVTEYDSGRSLGGCMSRRNHWIGSMILGLSIASQSFASDVEAKKDGVDVYQDATNKSTVIMKLRAGQSLPAGERKGMFWAVKTTDGKSGFVSVMAVKMKAGGSEDLAKAIKSAVKQGKPPSDGTEGRQRSAVMGVRGLKEDDNMANASNVRPNMRAVFALEDVKVQDKSLQKLGESVMTEIEEKASKN